jgi:hypothetical protein
MKRLARSTPWSPQYLALLCTFRRAEF